MSHSFEGVPWREFSCMIDEDDCVDWVSLRHCSLPCWLESSCCVIVVDCEDVIMVEMIVRRCIVFIIISVFFFC